MQLVDDSITVAALPLAVIEFLARACKLVLKALNIPSETVDLELEGEPGGRVGLPELLVVSLQRLERSLYGDEVRFALRQQRLSTREVVESGLKRRLLGFQCTALLPKCVLVVLLRLVEVELQALSHTALALQLLDDLLDMLCELLFTCTVFLSLRVAHVVEVSQLLQVSLERGDFL